jgi:hypothetical protein
VHGLERHLSRGVSYGFWFGGWPGTDLPPAPLLAAGVHAKVVAERLGHSRTQVTLDTYSHVAAGLQREAADVLDRLFACADKDDEATGEQPVSEDTVERALSRFGAGRGKRWGKNR